MGLFEWLGLEGMIEDNVLSNGAFWITFIVAEIVTIGLIYYIFGQRTEAFQGKSLLGYYFMAIFFGFGLSYWLTKRKMEN